ncbi:MAG TPA: hypothetical protein ENK19_03840 [Acidobacteria bacterium]|nr:hypothetical protein [Acidobacteriota bacterium]
MARIARFKITGAEAWYHVHSHISGCRGEFPLSEKAVTRRLVGLIEHFTSIYFCEVAAFCVMGNHYHLVLRFDAPRPVRREELEARARVMYPGKRYAVATGGWTDDDWERYRKRLFDLSEYMRNVQAAFARWYNRRLDRRGKLWADRFKSVVLGDMQAVLDCMLYVDLNPVRAGLVERPEEWSGSSIHLREIGKDSWLMALGEVLVGKSEQKILEEYRQRLYYRGAVRSKGNQAAISQEVLAEEAARGFKRQGMYRKRLGYFVDGLAVGTEEFIRAQLTRLRDEGRYRRRKNPIPQLGGIHLSLREQRSTSIIF